MKVVIINGSYHQNGVMSFLVDKFISGLKYSNKNPEIRQYRLSDIPIEFCKGCGLCTKKDGNRIGECPQSDYGTVKEMLQEMLDCDIIVYATPIYEKSVTAVLKRLMERSMPILYMGNSGPEPRNGIIKNKRGVILLSCGTPFPANIIQGISKYPFHVLSLFCGGFGCEKIEKLNVPGANSKDTLNDKYVQKVYTSGVKLGMNFAS